MIMVIQIPPETLQHIQRHFAGNPGCGSKFFSDNPIAFITQAVCHFPSEFQQAKVEADGRKKISLVFEEAIGTCNVVSLSDLTKEELGTLTTEERDGFMVNKVDSHRTFPTRECQIILGDNNVLITIFPGPLAPPLAQEGENRAYWDAHAFVLSTSK